MSTLDVRKIVNALQSFINAADQTDDGEMADVARQYADFCQSANDRLTRCGELLEKGHRSEALSLADQAPDLLELVSLCDFPEIDEWQDLCAQYGWKRSPSLLLSIANTINDTYATEKGLSGLLKTNRLLALQRAPICDRLSVLRELATLDPLTPFWEEDVATFEAQRARELVQLGLAARQSTETAEKIQFIDQYQAEDWHSAVPPELQRIYASLSTTHDSENVLPQVANAIAEATTNLDVARLEKAINQWNRVVARNQQLSSGWQPPGNLLALVGPGMQYLEQHREKCRQQAFVDDARALHKALIDEEDADKIAFYLAKAESHGYALPDEIQAELASFRGSESKQSVLNVLLVVVMSILAVTMVVILFLVYNKMTN